MGLDASIESRFESALALQEAIGNAMALPSVAIVLSCLWSGIKGPLPDMLTEVEILD